MINAPGRPPVPQAVAESMAKGVKKGVWTETRIPMSKKTSISEKAPSHDTKVSRVSKQPSKRVGIWNQFSQFFTSLCRRISG